MVRGPGAGSLFWDCQAEFIVLAKYVFYFGSLHLFSTFFMPEGISPLETLIRDAAPQLINATVTPHLWSVVLEV